MPATMNPPEYPATHAQDPSRRAEREVFNALQQQLPSQVNVIYSWAYYFLDGRQTHKEREADFLILWPGRGILVIEVKGGRAILRDAQGRWSTVSHGGTVAQLQTPPPDQAQFVTDGLANTLHRSAQWGGLPRPTPGWVLAFPGVSSVDPAWDLPRQRVLVKGDLTKIRERIEEALDYWSEVREHKWQPFDLQRAEVARKIIRPALTMNDQRGTREIIEETTGELDAFLTQEQRYALAVLRANRRVHVCGSAGTGKTVLARRFAEEQAGKGMTVLLLCHNRLLGEALQGWGETVNNVHAGYFAGFAQEVLHRAKRGVSAPHGDDAVQQFWRTELPEHFMDFLGSPEGLLFRFDVVLVDEAQDFSDDALGVLEMLVKEDGGSHHLFYDQNQDIYKQQAARLQNAQVTRQPLTQNLRNTRRIGQLATRLIRNVEMEVNSVSGPPIELLPFQGGIFPTVAAEIRRLVAEERVQPAEIAVLLGRSWPTTLGFADGDYGQWNQLAVEPTTIDEGVLCVRSDRAKGLERPVVILADFDDLIEQQREAVFVAITRAQVLLKVVTNQPKRWQKLLKG